MKKTRRPDDLDDPGGWEGVEKIRRLPNSLSETNLKKAEELKKQIRHDIFQHKKVGFPHTFGQMTKYSIVLTDLNGKPKAVEDAVKRVLVDDVLTGDLEDAKVINFCRTVQTLYPLKTVGDGNCLLHAVSMFMWGLQDHHLLLRRLVYIALVEDERTRSFFQRWQRDQKRLHLDVPYGYELTEKQWKTEWDNIVKAADDTEQTAPGKANKQELPFQCLEEIHIFVLANVIQRPIIVLAENTVRSQAGSILGPNNFCGIYLPLLWDPTKCIKTPIILAYHMAHFTPLVNMRMQKTKTGHLLGQCAVPLVTKNLEPISIHFLLDKEEPRANDILQQYLKVVEVNWTRSDGLRMMLAAKCDHTKIPEQFDLMSDLIARVELSLGSSSEPKDNVLEYPKINRLPEEVTNVGRMQNLALTSVIAGDVEHGSAHKNSSSDPLLLTMNDVAKKASGPRRGSTGNAALAHKMFEATNVKLQQPQHLSTKKCLTPGCEFFGRPENRGLCSTCLLKYTLPAEGEYEPSLMDVRCAHVQQCSNMASTNTYPYCHEHTSNRTKPSAESTRPSQSQKSADHKMKPTPSPYEPSITEYQCHHHGCKNAASNQSFPYCHQHKRDVPLLTPAQTQNIQEWINDVGSFPEMSMTEHNCAAAGCTNRASRNTFPYCHEHSQSPEGTPSLYTSYVQSKPVQQEPPLNYLCTIPGCTSYGSYKTHPYCVDHHRQKQGKSHSNSPKTTAKHKHQRSKNNEKPDNIRIAHEGQGHSLPDASDHWLYHNPQKFSSLDSLKVGTSGNCPVTGCKLFGPPALDYYCLEHAATRRPLDPNKELEFTVDHLANSVSDKLSTKCPSCYEAGKPEYKGSCSNCFLMDPDEDRDPRVKWSVNYENVKQSNPRIDDVLTGGRTPQNLSETSAPTSESIVVIDEPVVMDLIQLDDDHSMTDSTRQTGMANMDWFESFDIVEPVQKVVSKCVFEKCQQPSNPALGNLCEDCYNILQKARNPPTKTSSPSKDAISQTNYSERKQKPMKQTADPAKSDGGYDVRAVRLESGVSTLPCVAVGCDMFGSAQTEFYCSSCYKQRSERPVLKLTLQRKQPNSNKLTSVPCSSGQESPDLSKGHQDIRKIIDKPKQKLPAAKSRENIVKLTHEKNLQGQRSQRKGNVDLIVKKGDDIQHLLQMERKLRSSIRKCHAKNCNHFGNPAKYGFCNSCSQG